MFTNQNEDGSSNRAQSFVPFGALTADSLTQLGFSWYLCACCGEAGVRGLASGSKKERGQVVKLYL